MIVSTGTTFPEVLSDLRRKMAESPRVENHRWQGVEVAKDPSARMYELRNVAYEVDLGGVEDLDHWKRECVPNLPWADDHFLERVGGEPLNPGVEWRNWPWGKSADRFRNNLPSELGPRIPVQDWAYLAGMIDGEGTIEPRPQTLPTFQGRVSVGQKDRRVLDYLYGIFKVGKVHKMPARLHVLNGKEYFDPCHTWIIYGSANIRWLVTGCLPYLRTIKREKAEEMICVLDEGDKLSVSPKSHRKTVWGKEWPARFNHSYADRFWAKKLEGGGEVKGVGGGSYGDLNDLVELLVKDPFTRQAWFPLFHPEDTGWTDGGRKLCSLGYQFLRRGDLFHLWYPLRSCDLVRHYSDDCYLAVRMLLWVLEQCRKKSPESWSTCRLGSYGMSMTSLHCFENDVIKLRREVNGGQRS